MWQRIFIVCTLGLLFLVGCGNNKETSKKEISKDVDTVVSKVKEEVNNKGKEEIKLEVDKAPKKIGNKELTISKAVLTNTGEDKGIMEIQLLISNKSKESDGAGAFEFTLESEGKEIPIDNDKDNLNGVLEPGEEMKDSVFFEVPNSVKKAKLVYSVDDETSGEWEISIPKK